MATPIRPRLLKLSGEALAGAEGARDGIFDRAAVDRVAQEIVRGVAAGTPLGIVVGGGNIVRGRWVKAGLHVAERGDDMGMLATLINAIMLRDGIEGAGGSALVVAPHAVPNVAIGYDRAAVMAALAAGRVVVFGGGTGQPFFTTDTAAALRAAQIGAGELLKATTVDGVYTADPRKDPTAKRLDRLTFDQAVEGRYGVMDAAAFALCREQRIPIRIFDGRPAGALLAALSSHPPGTLVGG